MAWTLIDHTAVDRQEVSRAAFGYPVVDDLNDLNTRTSTVETRTADASTGNTALGGRVSTLESRTTDTSGVVGIGNQRLSDRLGAGVTTSATADSRLSALETVTGTHGRWYSTATSGIGTTETALTFTTVETPASGITYASGVFTVGAAGRYSISANLHGTFSTNTAGYVGLSIGAGGIKWAYQLSYIASSGVAPTVVISCAAEDITLAAGATFSVFCITTAGTVTLAGAGTHGTNVGIRRVG